MSILKFTNVNFYFEQDKHILTEIDMTIDKGEFHCLVGRSGCGKTTLLKLAAGLIKATSGQVTINGEKVSEPREDTGIVFQEPTLLQWKTVLDNVLMPIFLQRKVTAKDIEHAQYLLERMGIKEHKDRYPNQLSGGQKSRVSIARALMTSPSILFMDEPFAALDALTKEELQDDLLQLCKEETTTILFITHDIQEAVYLADMITVMEAGRITNSITNTLAREDDTLLRYSQSFNDMCLHVREQLEGRKR